jgi:uncharacterized protein YlxW (UPF0749 family)
MKKVFLVINLLCCCCSIKAQSYDSSIKKAEFNHEISKLSNNIASLKNANNILQNEISIQKIRNDSLSRQLAISNSNIEKIAESLHIAIATVSSENIHTQKKFEDVNQSIFSKTLIWIIGILLIAIFGILGFTLLRKKITSRSNDLDSQIENTRKVLESEAIKLDSKLVEILQTQLTIVKNEQKANSLTPIELNHTLPLKVGEEIHRMRKRIENMPRDIKGLSALINSLKRLEEEFNANGYEVEELLGKKYVDGMKVEARFVDNPDIPKGEEVITEILRPQINYKGVLIQTAKVEVSKSN